MSTEKFIIKTVLKIVVFIAVIWALTTFSQSMSPILSTEIAMGQMENSDTTYILMINSKIIQRVIKFALVCGSLCFTAITACDIYHFVSNKKEK